MLEILVALLAVGMFNLGTGFFGLLTPFSFFFTLVADLLSLSLFSSDPFWFG
jgi:hypothetical protein